MATIRISIAEKMTSSDIQLISSIHASSISHSRFATLPSQVQAALYEHCLNSESYTLFIAKEEGGALIGGALVEDANTADSQLLPFLLKKFPLQITRAVLRHPVKWLRQTAVESSLGKNTKTDRYLSAIYVSKDRRGMGIGQKLLSEIEKLGSLGIITEFNNKAALNFYQRNSYVARKSFLGSCFLAKPH